MSDAGVYPSLKLWFWGEHVQWNIAFSPVKFTSTVGMVFAANKGQVTCLSYAEGVFKGDFKGIPHLPTKEYGAWLKKNAGQVDGMLKREWLAQ